MSGLRDLFLTEQEFFDLLRHEARWEPLTPLLSGGTGTYWKRPDGKTVNVPNPDPSTGLYPKRLIIHFFKTHKQQVPLTLADALTEAVN